VKPIWRCFKESKGPALSFSASWASKKRLGRCRGSNVSRRRISLKHHNLLSGRLKCHFGEFDKAMIERVDSQCKLIFKHSGHPKKRLLRSRGIGWSGVFWFRMSMRNYFLNSGHPKKWLERSRGCDFLSRRIALITHNLASGRFKKEFREVVEAMFQRIERPWELIFYIHGIQTATWTKSQKWCFKQENGLEK
jgi:hypothetical protein